MLEERLFLLRQYLRDDHLDFRQQIAVRALGIGKAATAQAHFPAGRRAGRELCLRVPGEGRNSHLPAQRRGPGRHGHVAVKVAPATAEDRVRQGFDLEQKIAVRRTQPLAALAAEPDRLPGKYALRDIHLQVPGPAGRTVQELDRSRTALGQVLEAERQRDLVVAAATGPAPVSRAAAAGEPLRAGAAEEHVEEGAETGGTGRAAAAAEAAAEAASVTAEVEAEVLPSGRGSAFGLNSLPGGAVLVVLAALLLVLEHLVRLADVLEAALGARVLVHVRVELAGELAIGPLDIRRRGVLRDAQRLVVVLVFHLFSVPWV